MRLTSVREIARVLPGKLSPARLRDSAVAVDVRGKGERRGRGGRGNTRLARAPPTPAPPRRLGETQPRPSRFSPSAVRRSLSLSRRDRRERKGDRIERESERERGRVDSPSSRRWFYGDAADDSDCEGCDGESGDQRTHTRLLVGQRRQTLPSRVLRECVCVAFCCFCVW